MASASLSSSSLMITKTLWPHSRSSFFSLNTFVKSKNPIKIPVLGSGINPRSTAAAVRAEFSMSIFERELGGSGGPPPTETGPGFAELENEEGPECPPGLRPYETVVVLRPNMSEDERLAFIHGYEELLLAGGGTYVQVCSSGVRPLEYSIRKRNKAGETNTYLDGIDLLFTYFTKPESMSILGETLLRDDDVIRSSSFKIRKKKSKKNK